MHALAKTSFSCLNVWATAHAKAPKNLAFISKIVNKTFLLIADNLLVENDRYDISTNLVNGRQISADRYIGRALLVTKISKLLAYWSMVWYCWVVSSANTTFSWI